MFSAPLVSLTKQVVTWLQEQKNTLFKLISSIRDCNLNPKTSAKLFDHLIKPILLYGAETWGPDNFLRKDAPILDTLFGKKLDCSPLEKVDMLFNKFTLGVSKRSCNLAVRAELGRFPIVIDLILSILKYYSHIKKASTQSPLIGPALYESKSIDERNVPSWFTFVKNISVSLNIYLDSIRDLKKIKLSLRNKFISFWKSKMTKIKEDGGKLDL